MKVVSELYYENYEILQEKLKKTLGGKTYYVHRSAEFTL
jgi:hypothetical protein